MKFQKINNEYSDEREVYVCLGLGVGGSFRFKGYKKRFQDNRNVFYFECSDGYMGIYILKCIFFLYLFILVGRKVCVIDFKW